MSNIDKSKTALRVKNIVEYIRVQNIRKNTLFTFSPYGSYYTLNGERISESDFLKRFTPKLSSITFQKGANPNKGHHQNI